MDRIDVFVLNRIVILKDMALVTFTMNKYKCVHLLLFNAKVKIATGRIPSQGLHHNSVKMQDTRPPGHRYELFVRFIKYPLFC